MGRVGVAVAKDRTCRLGCWRGADRVFQLDDVLLLDEARVKEITNGSATRGTWHRSFNLGSWSGPSCGRAKSVTLFHAGWERAGKPYQLALCACGVCPSGSCAPT